MWQVRSCHPSSAVLYEAASTRRGFATCFSSRWKFRVHYLSDYVFIFSRLILVLICWFTMMQFRDAIRKENLDIFAIVDYSALVTMWPMQLSCICCGYFCMCILSKHIRWVWTFFSNFNFFLCMLYKG